MSAPANQIVNSEIAAPAAPAAVAAPAAPAAVSLDACELEEGIEFCSPGCCCLEYSDDAEPLSFPCALDGCNKAVEEGNDYCSLTCQSASAYNDDIARIIAESKAIREAPVSAFADLDEEEIPEVDIDAA